MAEEERILEVTPDFDGKRIDQCLAASFSDCSRSFLQKLLKDGKVSINGKTQKASSKVAAGDAVLVLLPEPEARFLGAGSEWTGKLETRRKGRKTDAGTGGGWGSPRHGGDPHAILCGG